LGRSCCGRRCDMRRWLIAVNGCQRTHAEHERQENGSASKTDLRSLLLPPVPAPEALLLLRWRWVAKLSWERWLVASLFIVVIRIV
jgi:hypothetical protein